MTETHRALKDILVHLDESRANAARLELGLGLAREHGAHLTGLFVAPTLVLPGYVAVELGPEVLAIQQAGIDERVAAAKGRFEAAVKGSGVSTEWRSVQAPPVQAIVESARHADLVVLGQHDPDDEASLDAGVVGSVILECGRPVLVVPYIGATRPLAELVTVAWNASRESARAVNDALALLDRAKEVTVLAVNPDAGDDPIIESADICVHLARHGVKAHAQFATARDIDVGDLLLSRAHDAGAGLIVMGAYGHSRLRETVLGGVTRHLLGHMTVPVLMSH